MPLLAEVFQPAGEKPVHAQSMLKHGARGRKRPQHLPQMPSRVAMQRFGNVRALWSAFLSVFRVELPKRGQRESLWAAAKGAAQKLVRGSQPAPPAAPPAPALAANPNEPSFAREALARSVF